MRTFLLVAGFALLIFAGKLALIQFAGSDLPFMDQWDAEGESVLRPWLEGRLHFTDLLAPHNEHRIITTKLYALSLFVANGQWDVFVQTTGNALVHIAVAVLLLLLARRFVSGVWLSVYTGFLLLLFALPFSWENTLFGFQVQFYFLLLFSVLHLWLTLESDRFSLRWAVGQLSGGLALASMASGFFSSATIVALLGCRGLRARHWTAQQSVSFALGVVICVLGWWSRTPVPGHVALHAHTPREFFGSLLQILAWPSGSSVPWVLLPAVLFVARCLRRPPLVSSELVLLALVTWTILQAAALAFARANGMVLSSRYLDLMAAGIALGPLLIFATFRGRMRHLLAGVWLVATLCTLAGETRRQWQGGVLPNANHHQRQEEVVRRFLQTGDARVLERADFSDLPYPSSAVLAERLARPVIQAVMPPSVRRPVRLIPEASARDPDLPMLDPRLHSLTTRLAAPHSFEWQSKPQSATALPLLRFRVAGDLGRPGRRLELTVQGPANSVLVTPDIPPGSRWKPVTIVRPSGVWTVNATDHDPEAWFAFSDPVELGYGTWCAEKLLKHHRFVASLGLILLAASAALPRRRASTAVARTLENLRSQPTA